MDEQRRAALAEQRIADVTSAAVGALSVRERQERIDQCRRSGWDGVDLERAVDGIELYWGGRFLAVIGWDALSEDGLTRPLAMTSLPSVPDTPAGLVGDEG